MVRSETTPRLLAIDLDGTLLRRDGTIHADDLLAIRRLQEAGVPVSIVTGRLYSGSTAAARTVGVLGPIACVDGSQIVDTRDDQPLSLRPITGQPASTLRRVLERHGAASFLFDGDEIVHDAAGHAYTRYLRKWSTRLAQVDRVAAHASWEDDEGLLAVVSVGERERIQAAAEEASVELNGTASVIAFPAASSRETFAMIVRALGASKGTAIEWLARHHGCETRDVVAVGDWMNDLTMFRAAGRSFVMAHAPESIKAAATDRLSASEATGGGIAEAVRAAWGPM